jgi:hypothetical protein
VQFARNTNVGSPSRITYNYTGPEGEGFDFAPGMNLANYTTVASGNFPTANVFLAPGLESPLTKEFTVSAGRQFAKGYGRVLYTWRLATNFIEDFIDDPTASGKIPVVRNGVNFGTFDRLEFRNSEDVERRYQGMQFLWRYDLRSNLYVSGHYTLQVKNEGNFEGEAGNQPANPSDLGDWPQILTPRSYPYGTLNDFQRSKLRLWAVYNHSLGRVGNALQLGTDVFVVRQRSAAEHDTGRQESWLCPFAWGRLPDALLRRPRHRVLRGIRSRGSGSHLRRADLGHRPSLDQVRGVQRPRQQQADRVEHHGQPGSGEPDADGLPTGYIKPVNFGTARASSDYPRPLPGIDGGRSFLMAFGLRF